MAAARVPRVCPALTRALRVRVGRGGDGGGYQPPGGGQPAAGLMLTRLHRPCGGEEYRKVRFGAAGDLIGKDDPPARTRVSGARLSFCSPPPPLKTRGDRPKGSLIQLPPRPASPIPIPVPVGSAAEQLAMG